MRVIGLLTSDRESNWKSFANCAMPFNREASEYTGSLATWRDYIAILPAADRMVDPAIHLEFVYKTNFERCTEC